MLRRNGPGLARPAWMLAVWVLAAAAGPARADDPPAKGAKAAVAPAAPGLPAEVVVAMQAGRYDEAIRALGPATAAAKSADDRAYLGLIRATAERLAGRGDAARATATAALEAAPDGAWAAKLRFEGVAVEVAAGRFAAAEALARAEAEAVLNPGRKDRLAGVYESFAARLLKPGDPITPPDPAAALAMLGQARALAKGDPLRARLLLAIARAGRDAKDEPGAIRDYRAYLAEYPDAPDRPAARAELGEALLAVNDHAGARATWSDLARDLDGKPGEAAARARAAALLGVARTYRMLVRSPDAPGVQEGPADDADLALGVAAVRRFLAAYPADPAAVRADFGIGASYEARRKSEEALAAFNAFLKGDAHRAEADAARRDRAELAMAATFRVAEILQGQEKSDQAIAAYRGYLAKFPNGPQGADAQRAILDTQLQIADRAFEAKRYADARAAWIAFAAENPLDQRVPELLFRVGAGVLAEKDYDKAIAAWEPLLGKFPDSEPAAHARFLVASIYEENKGDLPGAIERFKAIAAEPWASQARLRVAVMEAKSLTVVSPRAFRSGETAHLKIGTRNIETLTFSAFRLNPEAYFRKKHALRGVDSLDIGLVAPDAEWTAPVPGYGKFKPVETTYEMPKLNLPGVYVVKVGDEKSLQATALVLGSDLDAVVKASRDQVLVFAQDMKAGKGRPGARVLVADGGSVIFEGKAGADGVLLAPWAKPRDPGSPLAYLVLDRGDVAGSGLGVPGEVAQGLSPRAYIDTDRPAYRPGQAVAIRGVIREVKDGQYSNPAGASYRVDVLDSRGRLLSGRAIALSAFGTFSEQIELDGSAPEGTYTVRASRPNGETFAGTFEVKPYSLEKVDLDFDLPRTVYVRGEVIKLRLVARYQYGTPLANRPIVVAVPGPREVSGVTDAAGAFTVDIPTQDFAEDQALRFTARLPLDDVAASAAVNLAVRAFSIRASTPRGLYLSGESFTLEATTLEASGGPTGQALEVAVLKVRSGSRPDDVTEREVSRSKVATDPKTGKGSVVLKVDDEEGGTYRLRVSGADRRGNAVVEDRTVMVSGSKDATKLRILTDRVDFKVGETAAVNLHARSGPGTALLAWEADRVLAYRIVPIREGDNAVSWEVDGPQFPNFTLTACRMASDRFDEARLDVRVARDLRVTISPSKPTVKPGEAVEVEVTTSDQLGRPVAAEVAVALVDEALLRVFPDAMPAIGERFYDQSRTGAFSTASTNTFRDAPPTVAVPEAVVEEQERAALIANNATAATRMREEARDQASLTEARPIRAIPAPMAAGREITLGAQGIPIGGFEPQAARRTKAGMGMGGGMGGMGGGKGGILEYDMYGNDAVKSKDPRAEGMGRNDPFANHFGLFLPRQDFQGRSDGPATPRDRFSETAYWNPSVVTGVDGKARITFKAPSALSEYRFTARGVTGADTLVGQGVGKLAVRKDFFVDINLPPSFTEGDRPRPIAQVHHVGVQGRATLTLVVYAGGREATFPKDVDLKGDGVEEVIFDPIEVPDGETAKFTLTGKAGEAVDEVVVEVPIRPWGVQAVASASGTASDDATAIVALPPGRAYADPEMLVVVSPTPRRMLVELALGRDAFAIDRRYDKCIMPPPHNGTADRASDLIAAAAVLEYLETTKALDAPEAARLKDRIRGLVAELITVQNDDGGFPWVAGPRGAKAPSDRMTSVRATWAYRAAWSQALMVDPGAHDRAGNYLAGESPKIDPADLEARAAVLFGLSTVRKATFEAANSLNRLRQDLPDVALAYLAVTLANLDRASLADEVITVLASRAKSAPAAPGEKPRKYWEGSNQHWHPGAIETTALAALAYARVRPSSPDLEAAAEWLMAHRGFGDVGWQPAQAKGPALSALAELYGHARPADDRYELAVTVNDAEIYRARVDGASAGKAVQVPRRVLKAGDANRVRFAISGRGTYGYAVTLTGFARDFGPEQSRAGKSAVIDRRVYTPADPEFEGKPLPSGFAVALLAQEFENTVTRVPMGGRARVILDASQSSPPGRPAWKRDFLVVEEHLPAGVSLVEGTVSTTAQGWTLGGGVLTLYYSPQTPIGRTTYDVYGSTPGRYRVLPARIGSAYEPGRSHLGPADEFRVLAPGESEPDPYRPTPDEQYARGKALFDAGRLAEAAAPLEGLFGGYSLRDDVARDAARMLLTVHIRDYKARKVVQYFEVLKGKAPELVIPFGEIQAVGRAYRDINEHERAYLVWRAIVEASYLEDARVGEALRRRGRTLEGIAALLDLWREYPDTASIDSDFFGLTQVLAAEALQAVDDPATRRELAGAGVSRPELLLQAIRLIRTFLARSPTSPLADEASLAQVGAFLDLEDYPSVVALSERFAALYPKSSFLDSFQYSEALGRFQLGQNDRAVAVAEAIAKASYRDADGVETPSPNKWQALYILGQIYDARRQPARALEYYRQVAERFSDAAGAVRSLERRSLKLPEVFVFRPTLVAGRDTPSVNLEYRNVAEVDLKVYPVDLMRLYLTRRNLDGIAGIDLAGISPLFETTVKLGEGADYDNRTRAIGLPLDRDGAYLVMARGADLYASGIVIVTPLELDVLEEADAGRVRVSVRDPRTLQPVPKVQVKVIGSRDRTFLTGQTDLRGVFVAEGVRGQVTAVARQGTSAYAFHRGTTFVGTPDSSRPNAPPAGQTRGDAGKPGAAESLDQNLKSLNSQNRAKQIDRLEKRYDTLRRGVEVQEAR